MVVLGTPSSPGLSGGAIGGIVGGILGAVILALLGVLIFFLRRRRSQSNQTLTPVIKPAPELSQVAPPPPTESPTGGGIRYLADNAYEAENLYADAPGGRLGGINGS